MRTNSNLTPTNPQHVARAYGSTAPAPATKFQAQDLAPAVPAAASAAPASQTLPSAAQRLVSAVVPGRVDFSGEKPAQVAGSSAFQLYRQPADKNAAATGVSLGRTLDVEG